MREGPTQQAESPRKREVVGFSALWARGMDPCNRAQALGNALDWLPNRPSVLLRQSHDLCSKVQSMCRTALSPRHPCFTSIQQMGLILNKLFGPGGPMIENTMDIRCCDTEIISEASSSSSSSSESGHRTHASHHVASRPSFETLPPPPPTPPQLCREQATVRYTK